jgi:hypothetical protein
VIARLLGLWWLNACRIVYVVDEAGPVQRFGFAYGTLPEHAESGEERFTVEWHETDAAVWYDILAFSRPQQLLARLGYPLARRLQKRFARGSAAAMRRAVEGNQRFRERALGCLGRFLAGLRSPFRSPAGAVARGRSAGAVAPSPRWQRGSR